MAYAIPSGAVIEVSIIGRQDGQEVMNVYHYYMQKEGGIDDGRAAALNVTTTFGNALGVFGTWLDCVTNQVDNILIYGQWITPNRFKRVQRPAAVATEGNVLLDGLPSNCQASITLRGEQADRHNTGRKAMPGVPVDWVTNSVINPANLVTYDAHAQTLLNTFVGLEGEQYLPVIFNRVTPELSPQIVEAFTQDTIRIERRRTVRVGS